jgi:hypothetical protein
VDSGVIYADAARFAIDPRNTCAVYACSTVEAFESFVAVALEAEDFVVSGGVKFRVKLPTRKAAYTEEQTHGYEVDLVGARANRLVLASVKSAFGSRGVVAEHVTGKDERGPALSQRRPSATAIASITCSSDSTLGASLAAAPGSTSSELAPGHRNNTSGPAR